MLLALAAASLMVTVNGSPVRSEVPPLIRQGRVLLPARAVFNALGAGVSYDGKTGHVMVRRAAHSIQITVGSAEAIVDGRPAHLDVPAQVYDARTMVPLRFIAQSLGATVSYRAAERTVAIVDAIRSANPAQPPGVGYNGGATSPNQPPGEIPPYASYTPPPVYTAPPLYSPPIYARPYLPIAYPTMPISAFMHDGLVDIILPGQPLGGYGYVNLCGYGGNVPLAYDPARGGYYARLPLPRNVYESWCTITGYYYDANGGVHPLALGTPFSFDTRPRPESQPTPSPTPTPRDPAHTRHLEKATPSPSPSPAPRKPM